MDWRDTIMSEEAVKALIIKYKQENQEFLKKPEETHKCDINKSGNPYFSNELLVYLKAFYLFDIHPVFDLGSAAANEKIFVFLGDKFERVCKELSIQASHTAAGWLHLWPDMEKGYQYAVIPSEQMIPIWSKSLLRTLAGVIRHYPDITDDGCPVEVYEYWDDRFCQVYAAETGRPLEDALKPYEIFKVIDDFGINDRTNEFEHEAGEVPFFPFYNNITRKGDMDFVWQSGNPDNTSQYLQEAWKLMLEIKSKSQETEFRLGFGQFIRCVCRLLAIQIRDGRLIQTWTRSCIYK